MKSNEPCPKCNDQTIREDDRYCQFASGGGPVFHLTVKLRAKWCTRCEWVNIEVIPNKTSKMP